MMAGHWLKSSSGMIVLIVFILLCGVYCDEDDGNDSKNDHGHANHDNALPPTQSEPVFAAESNEIVIKEAGIVEHLFLKVSDSFRPKRYNCTPVFRDASNQTGSLILLNLTMLSQYPSVHTLYNLPIWTLVSYSVGNASLPSECTLFLFYLDWCPFSAKAAPHFNALARLFPQMNVFAVNSEKFYSISMKMGVIGVPSMFMFHRNKLVARFNGTEFTLPSLVDFLVASTNLEAVGDVSVTDADFLGPLVIDVERQRFRWLGITIWIFCILASLFLFIRSAMFQRIRDSIRNQWNEHLHAHID